MAPPGSAMSVRPSCRTMSSTSRLPRKMRSGVSEEVSIVTLCCKATYSKTPSRLPSPAARRLAGGRGSKSGKCFRDGLDARWIDGIGPMTFAFDGGADDECVGVRVGGDVGWRDAGSYEGWNVYC